MPPILVPTRGPLDWRLLLGDPERQWRADRSAALLAHAWEGAADFPPRVREVLGGAGSPFRALELLLAIPELRVPLPRGGHASQTDLWVLARGDDGLISLAVEAKVDEPFGKTLDEVMAGETPGQHERLRFLAKRLGLVDPPGGLRYQLLDRAVSALLLAERYTARHAVLLVQSFGARSEGLDDFAAFGAQLGASVGLDRVVPSALAAPARLWLGWVRADAPDGVLAPGPDRAAPRPEPLSAAFVEALRYAAEAHWGQSRKGTTVPYVSHCLAVAALVLEHGGDDTQAIAALLHDAVEDAGGAAGGPARRADIRRRFGDDVAEIVSACTDTDVTPKPPWRARKEAHVAHLAAVPSRALLVAAADKLHNLTAIERDYRAHGEALWERFNAPRDDILWYYDAVAAVFEARGPRGLAGELRRTLDRLRQAIAERREP